MGEYYNISFCFERWLWRKQANGIHWRYDDQPRERGRGWGRQHLLHRRRLDGHPVSRTIQLSERFLFRKTLERLQTRIRCSRSDGVFIHNKMSSWANTILKCEEQFLLVNYWLIIFYIRFIFAVLVYFFLFKVKNFGLAWITFIKWPKRKSTVCELQWKTLLERSKPQTTPHSN